MNMLCIKANPTNPSAPASDSPPFESQTTFLLQTGELQKGIPAADDDIRLGTGLEIDADLGSLPRAFRVVGSNV